MKSLLLMSVFFANVLIPVLAARDKNPRRGVKRMLVLMLLFNALYILYLTQFHPVWYPPVWGG
jgi:cyanate permease